MDIILVDHKGRVYQDHIKRGEDLYKYAGMSFQTILIEEKVDKEEVDGFIKEWLRARLRSTDDRVLTFSSFRKGNVGP